MFDETIQSVDVDVPNLTEERLLYYKLGQIAGILEKYSFFASRSINELKLEITSDKGIDDLLSVFRILKGIK